MTSKCGAGVWLCGGAFLVMLSCVPPDRSDEDPTALASMDTPPVEFSDAIADFESSHPGMEVVRYGTHGTSISIRAANDAIWPVSSTDAGSLSPSEIALQYIQGDASRLFGTDRGSSFEVVEEVEDPDFDGETIVRLKQTVNGRPVWGSEIVASVDERVGLMSLRSIHAFSFPVVDEPEREHQEASELANEWYRDLFAEQFGAEYFSPREQPERISLQLFDASRWTESHTGVRLAWVVSYPEFDVFIDDRTGERIYYVPKVYELRARETWDLQRTPLGGELVLNEDGAVADPPIHEEATLAHQHAREVYEYFFGTHRRDSYDGRGSTIESRVRKEGLRNARWHGTRKHITYGDGYAASLDIAAHEFTHGVVETTAALPMRNEQGAVNEFFADFFAVAAEGLSGSTDWTIGEALPGYSPERPMRDLANPTMGRFDPTKRYMRHENDGQPDHYDRRVTTADTICSSTRGNDRGCVHFNGGILGKAAHLMSEGGSHDGITVAGFGLDKTSRIMFRTLVKTPSGANLKTTAGIAIDACSELATRSRYEISVENCGQVQRSLAAVGLIPADEVAE